MKKGNIILTDKKITFTVDRDAVHFIITDTTTGRSEINIVPQDKFFKALAIAIHPNGRPNAELDYPDAESIMGKIRWIP
jgi:hypothetical protein